ncbi:MAG: leucine-rich repeat protein [Ruminococcus sp.]|nr:leucine-rich repeat protein [Ruminococcus sp.]
MRRLNIALSLILASSLAFQRMTVPETGKKVNVFAGNIQIYEEDVYTYDVRSNDEWEYIVRIKDGHEELDTLCSYIGKETDVYIPLTVDGLAVTSVSASDLIMGSDLSDACKKGEIIEELSFHFPEGCSVQDIEQSKNAVYSIYAGVKSVTLYLPDGTKRTFKRVAEDDPYTQFLNSEWEYKVLDEYDKKTGKQCIELTRYKRQIGNDNYSIVLPYIIGNYIVSRVSASVFGGKDINQFIITIPYKIVRTYRYEDFDTYPSPITYEDGWLDGNGSVTVRYKNYEINENENVTQRSYSYCDYTMNNDPEYGGNFTLQTIHGSEWYNSYGSEDKAYDIEVPDHIGGYPVRSVGCGHSISIPYDKRQFNIKLPDTVTYIAPEAFFGINVISVNIPDKVRILPPHCFTDCKMLKEISGGKGVQFISDELFSPFTQFKENENVRHCGEKSTTPDSAAKVFDSSKKLFFNYNNDSGNNSFMVTDEETSCTYRIHVDIDSGELSAELIYVPDDKPDIPDTFCGIPVTSALSDTVPRGCDLFIPDTVRKMDINEIRYYNDDLRTYENARDKYSALTRGMNVKSKDLEIGRDMFNHFSLTSVMFPGSIHIAKQSGGLKQLEKLNFTGEGSDIILDDEAFFYASALKELSFPKKCSELKIGDSAFFHSQISSLVIPEGTSYIGAHAFESAVSGLTINGSPKVGEKAFANNHDLKEVTVNGSPEFADSAFFNCTELENINIDISAPFNSRTLKNCSKLSRINGEAVFDAKGVPESKYIGFIEKNFKNSENNGIADKYVMYRIKNILAEMGTDKMSDICKVRAIHDKICSMVSYDLDDIDAVKNHTDISVFLNDSSVCDGYARAMNLMLHEAGIESCYVESEDHAWVIVKLGNHYFHVDPTWDDKETIVYDWFLKSDAEIDGKDSHIDWRVFSPSYMHDFQRSALPECKDIMGDVNGNGIVDGIDASAILSAYTAASVGKDTDIDVILADYDYNGIINAVDASAVLTRYAELSAGK